MDVLCRVVNEYSHHNSRAAVWVVFASTTSKVSDFSPPNEKHNSSRIAYEGRKLFPPYTQLGWDQYATDIQDIDVERVAELDHICGLRTAIIAYKIPGIVLKTASCKLCGAAEFKQSKRDHVLAVMGQRFGLNIMLGHPDSVAYLETAVASHLRICLATTLDRNWRFTSYPSEPLLSCVAAMDLHHSIKRREEVLGTFSNIIYSGMIDVGQRGELASRLLWLLAKDFYVRERAKDIDFSTPETWNAHLADCQMIPVVDWLEFVFGERIWDDKLYEGALTARAKFKDAYLNFSHWVYMEANIGGSKEGVKLPSLGRVDTTSLEKDQCCHQQPLIDKAIPIYFKGVPGGTSKEPRVSQIFISDNVRKSVSSLDALLQIVREHKDIGGNQDSDTELLPYIAILADLGQPPSVSASFPVQQTKTNSCLRIYAASVDNHIYPFLSAHSKLMEILDDLVRLQQIPETETPYREYLEAQVKFGSTANVEHMRWERGKQVPREKSG